MYANFGTDHLPYKCRDCDSDMSLKEDMSGQVGILTKLSAVCSKCGWSILFTDPSSENARELNTRLELADQLMGKSEVDACCSVLELPPPVRICNS